MKKIISVLLAMMLLVGIVSINAFAAGGISVSTGSLSLKPGENGTVTVSASNCAGMISVSSSDSSVATASASTDWIDSDGTPTASISISAKILPTGGTAMFALLALAGDLGGAVGPAIIGNVSEKAANNLQTGVLTGIGFPVVLVIFVCSYLCGEKLKLFISAH